MEVKQLTLELKKDFERLRDRYEISEKPEDKRSREFFLLVKEETTPVYNKIQAWEESASLFVKQRKVKVHPQQIASTKDNMELLLLNSYYLDAKRKRYMDLYQSIMYVFDGLLSDIEENQKS